MTPKDREHRIDTGSPEERVKAQFPDACCVGFVDGTFVVQWHWGEGWHPDDKGSYLNCTDDCATEAEAWADAASRLETK